MITITTVTPDRCANFDIENANWQRNTNPMQWLQYLPIPISVFVFYSYTQTLLHIYYTLVVSFKSVFYFYLFLIASPPSCARKKSGESPRAQGVSQLIDLRVIYIHIYYFGIYYNIIVLSGVDMLV